VINSVEALKTIFVAVVYKNQQSGRVIVFSILKIEKKQGLQTEGQDMRF